MGSKKIKSPDYDAYYDMPVITNNSEEGNNVKLSYANSGNALHGISCEYVYDEDAGKYLYERSVNSKASNAIESSSPQNKKPGHKRTVAGMYDELDYDDDHGVGTSNRSSIRGSSKKKKIFIASIIGTSFIGGIVVGAVFLRRGKYCFIF